MITEEEVQKALDSLRNHATVAAQATADRVYMMEYRKSLKAQLRQKADVKTEGAKDDYAYSHVQYLNHLDAIRVAVEADEKNRYLIKAATAKIEAWRTQEANHRGQGRIG